MIVLGIESSCDETAVAVLDDKKRILSNLVYSQIQEHRQFGGVVPEIAARSHIESLPYLFKRSLYEANLNLSAIDAIAVTAGPGLIGGVMVGVNFAKVIASIIKKPCVAVNHLEGHALTARFTNNVAFPYLLLLASGGHCQFLLVEGVSRYKQLATTIDDAAGEAFDKVAKMLNLGYPGGPIIEDLAKQGNPNAFKFPMPLCEGHKHNLSFSGLKTAVKNVIEQNAQQLHAAKYDICASFQHTVTKIFLYKIDQIVKTLDQSISTLVIAGGVAANSYIRTSIATHMQTHSYETVAPPIKLCTDNAAMIAWSGLERMRLGMINDLGFTPKSRWPLSSLYPTE